MSTEILLMLSNALTAIAGWYMGKRKVTAETDNMVLKNLELAIGVYQEIILDLKTEIHQLNEKVQKLEDKVEKLMDENRSLKTKNGL